MGIHDRDYYRDDDSGWLSSWSRWGAVVWLIVVTAVVFILQKISQDLVQGTNNPDLTYYGVTDPGRILQGEIWRLVTPIFLHGGLLHLVFNMFVLYWAGTRLEARYGSREFLLFYIVAGVFANILFVLSQIAGLTSPGYALGASGSVTAVLVLFACHYPRERVLLMFVLPMPVWLLVVLYIGLDLLGFISGGSGVGYAAHLGGALFGFVYYRTGWWLSGLIPRLPTGSRSNTRPKLRIVPAEVPERPLKREPVTTSVEPVPHAAPALSEPFEVLVDRVLEKVSKFGKESLTSEERAILFRASEVYKNRRK